MITVPAARHLAGRSRHQLWAAGSLRPDGRASACNARRRLARADSVAVPMERSGGISRRVVLHDARSLVQLRSSRHRSRRRAPDVPAVDGCRGRRRSSALPLERGLQRRVSRRLASVALAGVAIATAATLTIARNAEHQSWMVLSQTTSRWPTDVAHAAVGGELSSLAPRRGSAPAASHRRALDVRARYNLGIRVSSICNGTTRRFAELEVLVSEHPMREEVPWSRRVMGHAYTPAAPLAGRRRAAAHDARDDSAGRQRARLLVDAHNSHGIDLAESRES